MASPFKRFPGAPDGSYVTDEGWLVVGDEAWTAEEWAKPDSPRQVPDLADSLTERRRRWRESKRQSRAGGAA